MNNEKEVKMIADKAMAARKAREAAKKARDNAREKTKMKRLRSEFELLRTSLEKNKEDNDIEKKIREF